MAEFARIHHKFEIEYATDAQALQRVQNVDLGKAVQAAELTGIITHTDATQTEAGPPRLVVRTLCVELLPEFFAYYPLESQQEAVLRDTFTGSIAVGSAATCKEVEIIRDQDPCPTPP
jgi:hypothetical protein